MSGDALSEVFQELRAREPLFHHRRFVYDQPTLEATTADDFWEVGASGQIYTRDHVRRVLIERWQSQTEDDLVREGWIVADERLRPLGPDTFLFTYRLQQGARITRRATIWERVDDGGWRAIYHQGTPISDG